MADYGAPVFPFLAVGGYKGRLRLASATREVQLHDGTQKSLTKPRLPLGEDYTNAEALLMTFSLNNYPRNHTKFKVALQWETEFLKIVQEFQKNSSDFDFAYMSEVK